MFEINEPKVSRTPWFSTASGNVVYALNQMLVQNRGDEIRIAPAVPAAWKDYAFKLACHGNLVIEVAVTDGRLARLTLLPGDTVAESRRTLVLPKSLMEGVRTDATAVTGVEERDGRCRLAVRIRGRTDVVAPKPTE
jgi:cellobiose phosphorylase